ncbi:fimbrial biogenesis chaperone [Paraburkholderia elongata]|uniref:Fimbria/pilus periplasmic chaperone n=1 Tax=Paraburkholderia elongata TaxID=2675747 RepID=A0A972NLB1_9BURK|nr:molecular chaperone [Paraburkholderia elongata]NPT53882.1 fimbria/pilus periplasmic chaperone [Paraburkholderia elongata]
MANNFWRPAWLTSLILIAVIVPATVKGAGFQVSPIRVTLSPEDKSSALTVRNDGDRPVIVQVQTVEWTQSDGRDSYKPTEDILATPPIFTVQPGKVQILRVGLRRAPDEVKELSYRIYLQEVPSTAQPGFQGLQVALRLGLPMFVQAQQHASAALKWSVEQIDRERLKVRAMNEGMAHMQVTDFALTPVGEDRPIAVEQVATYVLPGQAHEWLLPIDPVTKLSGRKIRLKAYTDAGNADVEVVVEKK